MEFLHTTATSVHHDTKCTWWECTAEEFAKYTDGMNNNGRIWGHERHRGIKDKGGFYLITYSDEPAPRWIA